MKNIKHLLAALSLLSVIGLFQSAPVSALCTPLPTNRGSVTSTISVPVTGTYRVWSRIKTADATKNSYYLQIDDASCNLNIAASGITANTWTWIDYQGGTLASKLDVSLSAGSHTLIMAGKDDNVQLDRVILTQDTSCVPSGTGDNCAFPPDTTPPTVSITAPTSGATLSAVTNVTANAADDVAVSKVEFFVDGMLKNTDTATPYGFSLDPTTLTGGAHTLTAKAYDIASNSTTSAVVSVNTAAAVVADTTLPVVTITNPLNGATVTGTIAAAATASDNIAVTKVEFSIDGVLKRTELGAPYCLMGDVSGVCSGFDTTTYADGIHTMTAKAYDAAGNSATATSTFTVKNAAPAPSPTPTPTPTADTVLPTVVIKSPVQGSKLPRKSTVSATATDNVAVTFLELKIDGTVYASGATDTLSFTLNSNSLSRGSHTIQATAKDAAGNVGTSSITVYK